MTQKSRQRSRSLKELTRRFTPPTKNGHASSLSLLHLVSSLLFSCLLLSCLSSSVFSSLCPCLLSLSSSSVSVCLCLSLSPCVVMCCSVLCGGVWCVVCGVWCVVCGVWCVVCVVCGGVYVCAWCRYKRGRFERTHGDVVHR